VNFGHSMMSRKGFGIESCVMQKHCSSWEMRPLGAESPTTRKRGDTLDVFSRVRGEFEGFVTFRPVL